MNRGFVWVICGLLEHQINSFYQQEKPHGLEVIEAGTELWVWNPKSHRACKKPQRRSSCLENQELFPVEPTS